MFRGRRPANSSRSVSTHRLERICFANCLPVLAPARNVASLFDSSLRLSDRLLLLRNIRAGRSDVTEEFVIPVRGSANERSRGIDVAPRLLFVGEQRDLRRRKELL